jgi:5'/3'-nucleotidase surE
MSRPLFLLTNDDGITARGLQELARALSHIADICVVAPDTVRSGMSQAVTSAVPLRIEEYKKGTTPYPQYAVNGTPADCVKLALYHVLHRRPDMVIAGINHGSNASVNVLYSGTMGATLEGCIAGFPSIGFSLVNRTLDADLSPYLPWCEKIVRTTLEHGLPQGIALNVNLPRRQVQGIRVCRQTGGRWSNEFEPRKDPWGREYFWLTGTFENLEPSAEDTDDAALCNGYIAIVPTRVDLTDTAMLAAMKEWEWH